MTPKTGFSKKKCEHCGVQYIPTAHKQFFCGLKCRQEEYKETKKKINKDEMPLFACQFCGTRSKLDFDPGKSMNLKSWTDFVCPACGIPRMSEESKGMFKKI